ncbi:MAG: hypothetical protein L0154_28570 [Chloroflexi bacterium]|nr:hypothetical protein [Chloroflexota bacterium]
MSVNSANHSEVNRSQVFLLGAALFLILVGLYTVAYRGVPLSDDEYNLFDSIESFVQRGNLLRTITFAVEPSFLPDGTPARIPKYEPLQHLVSAPLFWVAYYLPGIGLVHAMLLLNIFVTALTAVATFIAGKVYGFSTRAAWLGALLYGSATLAFPYSQWFFREPLTTLWFIIGVAAAYRVRLLWQANQLNKARWELLTLIIVSIAGVMTKAAFLLQFPLLILLTVPTTKIDWRRLALLVGVGGLLLVIFLLIGEALDIEAGRYDFNFWYERLSQQGQWRHAIESTLGYQFSFTRSIWLYSPILFIGIPGGVILFRRREWQTVTGLVVTILLFTASYGIRHGNNWYGGWSWGPRYMLPFIPVITLLMMPALEWILAPQRHIVWRVGLILLVLLSFGIQLLGALIPYTNFYTELHLKFFFTPESADIFGGARADFNWAWSDSLLKYHLDHLEAADFTWSAASPSWLAPLLAVVLILAGIGLALINTYGLMGRFSRRIRTSIPLAALSLAFIFPLLSLFTLREDPRYIGDKTDVVELVQTLNETDIGDEDVIFLERAEYMLLMMNYLKTPALWITLPYAPGERYGGAEPEVVSDDLVALSGKDTVRALNWGANHYQRLWLVTSSGPFNVDMLRPIEHYLAIHYFPVWEIEVSQRARAIQYLTTPAPETRRQTLTINQILGNEIVLVGADLPQGTTYAPGDGLPVSLIWRARVAPTSDYHIGVFLLDSSGRLRAERNAPPLGGFLPMPQWRVDFRYRDNHGLVLPEDLEPGVYNLVVVARRWQDNVRLTVPGVPENWVQIAEIEVK